MLFTVAVWWLGGLAGCGSRPKQDVSGDWKLPDGGYVMVKRSPNPKNPLVGVFAAQRQAPPFGETLWQGMGPRDMVRVFRPTQQCEAVWTLAVEDGALHVRQSDPVVAGCPAPPTSALDRAARVPEPECDNEWCASLKTLERMEPARPNPQLRDGGAASYAGLVVFMTVRSGDTDGRRTLSLYPMVAPDTPAKTATCVVRQIARLSGLHTCAGADLEVSLTDYDGWLYVRPVGDGWSKVPALQVLHPALLTRVAPTVYLAAREIAAADADDPDVPRVTRLAEAALVRSGRDPVTASPEAVAELALAIQDELSVACGGDCTDTALNGAADQAVQRIFTPASP